MINPDDEKNLRQCFNDLADIVRTTSGQIKSLKVSEGDTPLGAPMVNTPADTNIYSFTLNRSEEDFMVDFKSRIEGVLEKYLPTSNPLCETYLLEFLNEFHYDASKKEFTEQFNVGMLDSFARELQCRLIAIDAYRAAFEGKRDEVNNFLKEYPTVKDKSGLWGTTLIYSAARNDHLELLMDLVETHGCSVNAQNRQHLLRALGSSNHSTDYFDSNSRAGSTALHAACFYKHLKIVKYLIEHGADYYIRNHSGETALEHANLSENSANYFNQLLIFGYSKKTKGFPEEPIDEDATLKIIDCVWEYKPFVDNQWFAFSEWESKKLQDSLIIEPNKDFQREIHLKTAKGIYGVLLMKFLRSGRDLNYGDKLAWIRCRGSSFENFNCYPLWQILLTKHPETPAESTLDMIKIPVNYDSKFQIRLNTWYFCNAQTSEQIDKAMKYRRKFSNIIVPLIHGEPLEFDLENFSFTDREKKISGFLRWIPKMISNNSRNEDKIIDVDEYATLTNIDPIPLTVSRLKHVSELKNLISTDEEEELAAYLNDEDYSYDDRDDSAKKTSDDETQSLSDLSENESIDTRMPEIEPEKPFEQFLKEEKQDLLLDKVVEESKPTDNSAALAAMSEALSNLQKDNTELENELKAEREKFQSLVNADAKRTAEQAAEYEKNVFQLQQHIESLEEKEKNNEKRREELQKLNDSIRTAEYINIEKHMMNDIFTPKHSLIIKYLLKHSPNPDPSFNGRIPQIKMSEGNASYCLTLMGFPEHHNEFKRIYQRIHQLLNIVKSAKDFYQRHLNRTMYSLIKGVLSQIKPQTNSWREYKQLFFQLFQKKNAEYKQSYDDYINNKLTSMIDACILGELAGPVDKINDETNKFIENHPFNNEINSLKQKALDEFIDKHISYQQLKFESAPTKESISTIKYFVEKVQKEFQTAHEHQGYELEHFNRIPTLLERLLLYFSCFKIQLPLFESSRGLLEKIDKYLVTTISTSTGSGKSTLSPALLIAEGYDRVIVTQPRRLPCQLISKRVNETMKIDIGKSKKELAGWAVSGIEQNPQGKVLYLTDGLLKERLLYDKSFVTENTNVNKSIVFFIDEVHERSVNIDLCLALLARLLSDKPELQIKVRVVISSATLGDTVPDLFRRHLHEAVTKFEMPTIGLRFPVKQIPRPNENVIDVVLEICKKRKRHDQILCFVSSVSEVNQCCRLIAEISKGTVVAYPLVQAQHPNVQQANIEHGTLFFSTTVAETSLTFPSLKYVVDTGLINIPVYDIESKRTVLREIRAAESTIRQRLGRLGRTQPGEYYSVYNFKPSDVPFPIAQICQSDLMNLEFSLQKSPLREGLGYLKTYLPDPPSSDSIAGNIRRLQEMNIVDETTSQLTAHGRELAKLPDFGSLAMSKATLAALNEHRCGRDLISLAAFLGVLNTTTIFRSIPQRFKSPDGDFMTLVKIMNEILLVKQSTNMKDSDIDNICQAKGLTDIQHVIKHVLKRYKTLQDSFKLSTDFRHKAQQTSGKWESIAKSLLAGYSDNVFISMKDLYQRIHHFVRHNDKKDIAILDLQSTLIRPINTAPVSLVLARDIRRSTAVREKAILSFLGEIKPEWINYTIQREIDINDEEEKSLNIGDKFKNAISKFRRATMTMFEKKISLKGSSGEVLNAELHLRQEMVTKKTFTLESLAGSHPHANFERNLESLTKMPRIFNPLIWRRKAQNQADVTVNMNTATRSCEITIEARDSVYKEILEEFKSFIGWLQYCAVISHPNAGLSPRVLRPQMRSKCREIEERIARVTDSRRTPIDLYNGTKGAHATRETRMEVVAWIAICKFDCRLEGGFVRDWIVGHYTDSVRSGLIDPNDWIDRTAKVPAIKKEIVPCDLDCHLPSHAYFDIQKFQDELYKYGILCSVERENWRYVLLVDEHEPTGPFTMDLIEPHIALAHDRIDFDVNNLFVEKDYTHEFGMRIDITENPYSIQLEAIIENIQNKRFQLLRPRDARMDDRIEKMIKVRGWQKIDEDLSVVPKPHRKYHAVLVPLPKSAALYKEVTDKMNVISSIKIRSIEEIRNPYLEETYEGMKKIIKKQCQHANPNEQLLFHGTSGDGVEGIVEDGFDDRYYAKGMYGYGAYFADNPSKSDDYTGKGAIRVIYYSKVLIGKPRDLTAAQNDLVAAPIGFHSVIGRHSPRTEFIVYRYGQALPYLKIVYSV